MLFGAGHHPAPPRLRRHVRPDEARGGCGSSARTAPGRSSAGSRGRSPRRPDRPQERTCSLGLSCARVLELLRSRLLEGPVALGARPASSRGFSSATTWSGGARLGRGQHAPRERRGQALGTVFGARSARLRGLSDVRRCGSTSSGILVSFVGVHRHRQPPLPLVVRAARLRPTRGGGEARCAIGLRPRDRFFLGGLWLNTLPALFFGVSRRARPPCDLDDAGYGVIAIAAVFVIAGTRRGRALTPLSDALSDRRGRLLPVRVVALRRRLPSPARWRSPPSRSSSRSSSSPPPSAPPASTRREWHWSPIVSERAGLSTGHRLRRDEQRVGRAGALIGPAVGRRARPGLRRPCSPYLLCGCALRAHAKGWATRPAAWARHLGDRPDAAGNRSSAHDASSSGRR